MVYQDSSPRLKRSIYIDQFIFVHWNWLTRNTPHTISSRPLHKFTKFTAPQDCHHDDDVKYLLVYWGVIWCITASICRCEDMLATDLVD